MCDLACRIRASMRARTSAGVYVAVWRMGPLDEGIAKLAWRGGECAPLPAAAAVARAEC